MRRRQRSDNPGRLARRRDAHPFEHPMIQLPFPAASPQVEVIRARYEKRLIEELPLEDLAGLPAETREAARRFWSERAWSEYSALPAQAQVLLQLVKTQAPLSEIAALTHILADESLHTALSMRVADACGGYLPEVPSHLDFDPQRMAMMQGVPLEAWVVVGGCIAETTSRALIRARLDKTRHPKLKALIARTLEDENIHVAYNWQVAERTLREAPESLRRAVAQMARPTLKSALQTQQGKNLGEDVSRAERNIRDRVAEAGLGACSFDEEAAVLTACVEREVLPHLQRLAVPVA
jgi:hypothetical protein